MLAQSLPWLLFHFFFVASFFDLVYNSAMDLVNLMRKRELTQVLLVQLAGPSQLAGLSGISLQSLQLQAQWQSG